MKLNITLLITLIFVSFHLLSGQQLRFPKASPFSKIKQQVGISEVVVSYHSPAVKGRKIWGEVVPFGQIWRTGANENTVFYTSHDVKIQGKKLPAGRYGLHMIPSENGVWTVIFSHTSKAWGSFTYQEKEDALRVRVNPKTSEFREWLSYEFLEKGADFLVLSLAWENLRIPIRLEYDVHGIVIAGFKKDLRTDAQFDLNTWNQAAQYCLNNNVELEQGLEWVNQSISGPFFTAKPTFSNLQTKARLLEKLNRKSESKEVMAQALALTTVEANDLYQYGRQLVRENKPEQALEVFKMTNERFPKNWLGAHGLARGYSALGNFKEAVRHEERALKMAPEVSKEVVMDYIERLKKGEDIN